MNIIAKYNITTKGQVNKSLLLKLNIKDNIKYKVEVMKNCAIFANKSVGQLLGLYFLVSWKSYLENKITGKQVVAVI